MIANTVSHEQNWNNVIFLLMNVLDIQRIMSSQGNSSYFIGIYVDYLILVENILL